MPGAGLDARRPTRWWAPASSRTTASCVGQGAHERAGEPHAEIHALDEAGTDARGATLYCTLEPCAHTGAPGPAPSAIIAAGIRRVVAAMEDPFPLVSGRGFAALRAHGIQVEVGVEHDAAVRLNQPFLTAVRTGRPFVIAQGGDEHRRPHRRSAGRAHAADVAAPRFATRNPCGRRWTR